MVLSICNVVVSAILLASITAYADVATHPYTVDDYLALETTNAAVAHGNRIIWEQAPAYDQLGYYGFGSIGAWADSAFQLMTLDLLNDEISPELLFEPEPKTSYWIDSVSPDGRFVAFYAARDGAFFMGAYDLQWRKLETFDIAPVVHWYNGRESIWVSSEEFIVSAYAEGEQPVAAARPHTGKRLHDAWQTAWSGGVSVSVETSGLDGGKSPQWKKGTLYKANAATGELTLLAEGKYESLKVSTDGRYLAGLRQADLSPPDPDKPNVDWVLARSELHLFDLRDGGPPRTIMSDKDVFPETLAWAPDTNRLAFFAWDVGAGVQSGTFHALDVKSGAVTPWPHRGLDLASERERGFAQKPERAMWVDDRLAVFARQHDGNEARLTYRDIASPNSDDHPGKADWFLLDSQGRVENLTASLESVSAIPIHADAETLTVLADGDVWRVGPDRKPVNLTSDVAATLFHPSAVRYSTLHRQFRTEAILVGRDAEHPGFALINLKTGRTVDVPAPTAHANLLAGAVKAGAVLFRQDHADGADITLKFADGRAFTVDRLNEHLENVAKTEWTTISYEVNGADGAREVESCILLPPDYEKGKLYPVIVEVYPSRGANCTDPDSKQRNALGRKPGPYSEHLLAAKGYIVFKPNTSRDITWTEDGPLSGMTDVVLTGLDALVEQGYGDVDRVGLLGLSQGGFSSLWVATQTDRFKAVVSLNGWTDMYSHYFGSTYLQAFYSDEFGFGGSAQRYEATAGTDFAIGKTPYEDPDPYVRNSPLFKAPDITAPVLLIHSDMDSFALSQYERFYTALYLKRKKAKLLRYWGEGHAPSSPKNLRHMWHEIFQWYEKYLGPAAE